MERDKPKRSEPGKSAMTDQGLPPCKEDSPRLTVLLRPEEIEALLAFAEEHHWRISTAIRAILREKLFDEELPF